MPLSVLERAHNRRLLVLDSLRLLQQPGDQFSHAIKRPRHIMSVVVFQEHGLVGVVVASQLFGIIGRNRAVLLRNDVQALHRAQVLRKPILVLSSDVIKIRFRDRGHIMVLKLAHSVHGKDIIFENSPHSPLLRRGRVAADHNSELERLDVVRQRASFIEPPELPRAAQVRAVARHVLCVRRRHLSQ